MKRISVALLTIFLMAMSLSSCKQAAPEVVAAPESVVVTSGILELNDQEFGVYYGDRNRNSVGVYSIVLSNGLCYRDGNGEPYLDSQGDMLVLELNGAVLPENVPLNIPAGKYIAGDTKSGSLSINLQSSYVLRLEGHTQSRYQIKSGAVSVVRTPDGGYDIVSEDMVLSKNGTDYAVNYSFYGDLKIEDYNVLAPTLVTVKDDIIDMPLLEFAEKFFVNVVCPVVDLQDMAAVFRTAKQHNGGCNECIYPFHYFSVLLAARAFLRFITIRRVRMPRNMMVIIGRSSGVSPPFRASV